jgi:hypothetical protein
MRFSPDDYAELLGLYLGDGFISYGPRTTRLRITLDAKYPGIVEDTRSLLERCFPHNDVHVGDWTTGNCLSVSVYCSHLVCLYPQHGHGLKHSRRILLEPWQREVVDSAPWAFLRGCIRSDGCAFVNRTGPYEYLSYDFSNSSEDIIRLFVEVSDGLQLKPRVNQRGPRWHVRINRRESVTRMVRHVGRKA